MSASGSESPHGSAAIIAEHLIPIPEDEPPSIESHSFQRHFKRLGRMELSDSVVVGRITKLDIDSRGRLLILDYNAHEVFLFNSDGTSPKVLSAEACHPGFAWRPTDAVFSPTDEILTLHAGPKHVRFDERGDCAEILEFGSTLFRANVFTANRQVFSYVEEPTEYYIRHFDEAGRLVRRFGEQSRMKTLVSRVLGGGLVQDSQGRLYQNISIASEVFVYDTSGTALSVVGTTPEYFREVEDDIPEDISGRAFLKAVRQTSLSMAFFLLDDDKLLLSVTNLYEDKQTSDRYRGVHVISTTGKTLTQEPVLMPARGPRPAGTRDGLIFFITDPVEDENGDWGNQGLEVYRFVK